MEDNHGLLKALESGKPVLPIFIFDPGILEELDADDARVSFLMQTLKSLRTRLQESVGSSIALYHGQPVEVFKALMEQWEISGVYTNRDYEPYAQKRDQEIQEMLEKHGIAFHHFKDQVIFEKAEVTKEDGQPYVVYTPYMRKWKEVFGRTGSVRYPSEDRLNALLGKTDLPDMELEDMGFEASSIQVPEFNISEQRIEQYEAKRNLPAIEGTSRLGPHLRFGTVSIRRALEHALESRNETFWNELIWREFFMQILWHFPHTVSKAFKPKYDRIAWRNDPEEFEKWKKGETGFALVDAGMRQLNETGYMHNRVRMLTASFLCKHLLIDWRWGEAYFAGKLLDYEMSSNVGNWQWAAGSGVDAAPYFRIFNPITQVDKFDKDRTYIRKWVRDFGTDTYPKMMVDHKEARERCLQTYKAALN